MIWLAAELPPDIPPACVIQASELYSVPPELLAAVIRIEGGAVGKKYVRKHGTYFGPTQISDKWLSHFESTAFTAESLQYDACSNVKAGAYILAYYQVRENDWSRAIARYNVGSLNTERRIEAGERYVGKVLHTWEEIYKKWQTNAKKSKLAWSQ